MKRLVTRHSLALRWFHWINFPLIAIMLWSGLLIYSAYAVYSIAGLRLFPKPVFDSFHLSGRITQGIAWHFAFMWLFMLNGILYVGYTLMSGEWRELLPDRHCWKAAWRVLLCSLHLTREAQPQQGKYNAAQRIAYTSILIMGIGSVLTGLAIFKPVRLSWLVPLLGGYPFARFLHFWLAMGYVVFFVVHVVQVLRAGWNNFRAMMTGHSIVAMSSDDSARSDDPPDLEQVSQRLTRRGFVWTAVGVATGFSGWRWLVTRRKEDALVWPLRRSLEWQEKLSLEVAGPSVQAPTFPAVMAEVPPITGRYGMSMRDFDPAQWSLHVSGLRDMSGARQLQDVPWSAGGTEWVIVTLEDIKRLPRVELVAEIKCVNGWNAVVHWAGARFADFIAAMPPAGSPAYVSLVTPNGKYYVGYEMESALHPQTLLCYEMNGRPLPLRHGGPLRLICPIKYGYKSLKRIGYIRYTDERPADLSAELGFDWYGGL